jgi:hypothetical protein
VAPVAKRVSLRKRFPGRHAISATVVLPSGNRVTMSGPLDGPTAELVLALLTADTSGRSARSLMADLKRELDDVSAEAAVPKAEASDG